MPVRRIGRFAVRDGRGNASSPIIRKWKMRSDEQCSMLIRSWETTITTYFLITVGHLFIFGFGIEYNKILWTYTMVLYEHYTMIQYLEVLILCVFLKKMFLVFLVIFS